MPYDIASIQSLAMHSLLRSTQTAHLNKENMFSRTTQIQLAYVTVSNILHYCVSHLANTETGYPWLLQGVARVLSKLPSLQSMTQRLRATSHKAMLPGTVDEAKEEHRIVSASVSTSEAHVVVFVHGFRVSFPSICVLKAAYLPAFGCSKQCVHSVVSVHLC